jgi:hypothetical protein
MVSHSSSEVNMRFTTAKEYVDVRINEQKRGFQSASTPMIIDVLRELPRDEAQDLLSIYSCVCDGDYGYGSWSEGYRIWLSEK